MTARFSATDALALFPQEAWWTVEKLTEQGIHYKVAKEFLKVALARGWVVRGELDQRGRRYYQVTREWEALASRLRRRQASRLRRRQTG